jgi:hypothetical protein
VIDRSRSKKSALTFGQPPRSAMVDSCFGFQVELRREPACRPGGSRGRRDLLAVGGEGVVGRPGLGDVAGVDHRAGFSIQQVLVGIT